MKDSMLSIISNTHDRLNTNALLGMLASLYPALAPLTSIGAILSSYNSANQEKKFKEFALELANTLKKHEEKLQNIPDDLEELVLIASDGILRTPLFP